jgi:hypothetical protein
VEKVVIEKKDGHLEATYYNDHQEKIFNNIYINVGLDKQADKIIEVLANHPIKKAFTIDNDLVIVYETRFAKIRNYEALFKEEEASFAPLKDNLNEYLGKNPPKEEKISKPKHKSNAVGKCVITGLLVGSTLFAAWKIKESLDSALLKNNDFSDFTISNIANGNQDIKPQNVPVTEDQIVTDEKTFSLDNSSSPSMSYISDSSLEEEQTELPVKDDKEAEKTTSITSTTSSTIKEDEDDKEVIISTPEPEQAAPVAPSEPIKEENEQTNGSLTSVSEDVVNPSDSTDIIDSVIDVHYTVPTNINMSYADRTSDQKFINCKENYNEMISEEANKYGIDPKIMLAIATQESGVHNPEINSGGAVGLMQIQYNVWVNKSINAYNFQTKSMETININDQNIRDLKTNVDIACAIYQNSTVYMKGNLPATLQAYNWGCGGAESVLKNYASDTGQDYNALLNNFGDTSFLSYFYGQNAYANLVSSYIETDEPLHVLVHNADGTIKTYDYQIVNSFQKSYSK